MRRENLMCEEVKSYLVDKKKYLQKYLGKFEKPQIKVEEEEMTPACLTEKNRSDLQKCKLK